MKQTILTLAVVLLLLTAWSVLNEEEEMFQIGQALQTVCDKQVNQQCQAALEASQKASPSEYPLLYQKYKSCLKQAYNKCACQGAGKEKVLNQCFENIRNMKAFQQGSRAFGCYALKNKAEKKACFENPYKYLCARPDSMACQEIKQLCDLGAVCP